LSRREVVLLGPQFHDPTVGIVLDDLNVTGPVATITAGWQEWENEDAALMRQLGGHGIRLSLYARAERVWEVDPELRAAHRKMGSELRTLRNLYNRQLDAAAAAWVELLETEGPEHLIQPERDAALRAIQTLDEHLLRRIDELRADFDERLRPLERPSVQRERREIREILGHAGTVVVEGGHVAVLMNRLALFGVPEMLGDKTLVGCAGGAMALCSRVVLYNDQPAVGKGHSEVALRGLGVAPGIIAIPDAGQRLRTDDADRMRKLALRVAPDRCALLDPGARLYWNGERWDGLRAQCVLDDGSILEWEAAA
jgi:hypothetical protein